MISSLKIENFRCFQSFELHDLGRLNLLVGTNNSGKTSILEALNLLTSHANLSALEDMMLYRGEDINSDELDIRHLFYGHEIESGSRFSIQSIPGEIITVDILHGWNGSQEVGFFTIDWSGYEGENESLSPSTTEIELSPKDGIPLFKITSPRRESKNLKTRNQFVPSSSFGNQQMIEMFGKVALTPEEELVVQALQNIDPSIERIALIGSDSSGRRFSRGGLVVRLAGEKQRIPIGNLGDGIWRMLGLALAIVNARDGVLLVDEIDTGLHFSAMSKMWKLIWETAKRLNVQVFATTHNSDCWTSLAELASTQELSKEGITIHRIEKDKPHSIVFTERQMAIAAERGIEVR
jgi:predicted ATP-dependent endonuclease of OLD family